MLLILDTSVIVSMLLSRGHNHMRDIILLAHTKVIHLLYAQELLYELKETMSDKRIKSLKHYNSRENARFIAWYQHTAQKCILTPEPTPVLSRDREDNVFLRLAMMTKANYLLTGDKDLLILKQIEATRIVKPEEFMRLYMQRHTL